MVKVKKHTNPVVMRRGVGIGSGNAESDDDFLFDCFVDYSAVDQAIRLTSPGMILAGRTGAGKTAILRFVENKTTHAVAVDPFEMAMSYVANSDTLRFLTAIGADLDLLFQVLWKHVLCIEFIRIKFSIENVDKSQSIFSRILERFKKEDRRAKAIAYLDAWQGKFWITMDQNIKEITEIVEDKLHSEFGAELQKFKAGGQYDKRLSQEKKSEIIARFRKVISESQLVELHSVIDMLSNFESDYMRSHFILIDRLDERWVDDSVRFRLIKALIETLRSFRKIRDLKILVSLRTDVLERVVQETADISFQREKFEDYKIDLRWTKADLKLLVEKRINALYKRQYTSSDVKFVDIFPLKTSQKDTFDWMLERTLMRPRDIIAFVNECIDAADGKGEISLTAMRQAEMEFSRKRRDALLQEWRSAFPTLEKLLSYLVRGGRWTCNLSELCNGNDSFDEFCLVICADGKIDHDPLYPICQARIDGKGVNDFKVAQEAAAILYRTGAVGVKINPEDRFQYAHLDQPLISPDVLTPESKLRLHPMLWGAYNIRSDNRNSATERPFLGRD